jgi:hypothetical protein
MNSTTNIKRKAIQAAILAVSAEKRGNDGAEECTNAAKRAGALAHKAGMTLDQLKTEVPELMSKNQIWGSLSWDAAVDGWYDTAEGKN